MCDAASRLPGAVGYGLEVSCSAVPFARPNRGGCALANALLDAAPPFYVGS
jgi:hypothetical protein